MEILIDALTERLGFKLQGKLEERVEALEGNGMPITKNSLKLAPFILSCRFFILGEPQNKNAAV
jgi:hypothetical protein